MPAIYPSLLSRMLYSNDRESGGEGWGWVSKIYLCLHSSPLPLIIVGSVQWLANKKSSFVTHLLNYFEPSHFEYLSKLLAFHDKVLVLEA